MPNGGALNFIPYNSLYIGEIWKDIQADVESDSLWRSHFISSGKVALATLCSGAETVIYPIRGALYFGTHLITHFDVKKAFIDLFCNLYAGVQSFTLTTLGVVLLAGGLFFPKQLYSLINPKPTDSYHSSIWMIDDLEEAILIQDEEMETINNKLEEFVEKTTPYLDLEDEVLEEFAERTTLSLDLEDEVVYDLLEKLDTNISCLLRKSLKFARVVQDKKDLKADLTALKKRKKGLKEEIAKLKPLNIDLQNLNIELQARITNLQAAKEFLTEQLKALTERVDTPQEIFERLQALSQQLLALPHQDIQQQISDWLEGLSHINGFKKIKSSSEIFDIVLDPTRLEKMEQLCSLLQEREHEPIFKYLLNLIVQIRNHYGPSSSSASAAPRPEVIKNQSDLDSFILLCERLLLACSSAEEAEDSETSILIESELSLNRSFGDSELFESAWFKGSTLGQQTERRNSLNQELEKGGDFREGALTSYISIDNSIEEEILERVKEQSDSIAVVTKELARILNQAHLTLKGYKTQEGKSEITDRYIIEHNLLSLKIYLSQILSSIKSGAAQEVFKAHVWMDKNCRAGLALNLKKGSDIDCHAIIKEIALIGQYLSFYEDFWDKGVEQLLSKFDRLAKEKNSKNLLIKALRSNDTADHNHWMTREAEINEVLQEMLENQEDERIVQRLKNLQEPRFVAIKDAPLSPRESVEKPKRGLLSGFNDHFCDGKHPFKQQKYSLTTEQIESKYGKLSFCAQIVALLDQLESRLFNSKKKEVPEEISALITDLETSLQCVRKPDEWQQRALVLLQDIDDVRSKESIEALRQEIEVLEADYSQDVEFVESWINKEIASINAKRSSTPFFYKVKSILACFSNPQEFDSPKEQHRAFVEGLEEATASHDYKEAVALHRKKRQLKTLIAKGKSNEARIPHLPAEEQGVLEAENKKLGQEVIKLRKEIKRASPIATLNIEAALILQRLALCRWSQSDIMTYQKGAVHTVLDAYENAVKKDHSQVVRWNIEDRDWNAQSYPALLEVANEKIRQAPAHVKKPKTHKNLAQKAPAAMGVKKVVEENLPNRRSVTTFERIRDGKIERKRIFDLRHARPIQAGSYIRLAGRMLCNFTNKVASSIGYGGVGRISTGESVLPDYKAFLDAMAEKKRAVFVTNFQTRVDQQGFEIESDAVEAETRLQDEYDNFFHMVQTFSPEIFASKRSTLGELYEDFEKHFGLNEELEEDQRLCDLPKALKDNPEAFAHYRGEFKRLFQKAYEISLKKAGSPDAFDNLDLVHISDQQQFILVFYAVQRLDMLFRLEELTGQTIECVNDHCKEFLDRAAAAAQIKNYLGYLMILEGKIGQLGHDPSDQELKGIIAQVITDNVLRAEFYALLSPAILAKKQEIIWNNRLEPACRTLQSLNEKFLKEYTKNDLNFDDWRVADIHYIWKEDQPASPTPQTVKTLEEMHAFFSYLKDYPDTNLWQQSDVLTNIADIEKRYRNEDGTWKKADIARQVERDLIATNYWINGSQINFMHAERAIVTAAVKKLAGQCDDSEEIIESVKKELEQFALIIEIAHGDNFKDYLDQLKGQLSALNGSQVAEAITRLSKIRDEMPRDVDLLIDRLKMTHGFGDEEEIYHLLAYLHQGLLGTMTTELFFNLKSDTLHYDIMRAENEAEAAPRFELNFEEGRVSILGNVALDYRYGGVDEKAPSVMAKLDAQIKVFWTRDNQGKWKPEGTYNWKVHDVCTLDEIAVCKARENPAPLTIVREEKASP